MKNAAKQLRNSRILRFGLLTAPCAVLAVSLRAAFALGLTASLVYVCVTVCTAPIPKRLPVSLRVVFYSVIAGLVYIPAALPASRICPQMTGSIYLPLCCAVLSFSEKNDRLLPHPLRLRKLLTETAWSFVTVLTLGAVRELLGSGSLLEHTLTEHPPLPFLTTAAGGVILLTVSGAAAQYLAGLPDEKEAAA